MFFRKRSPRRTALQLECLEDRLTPSGNVTASLLHGTLTLTGDQQANHVVLSQPGPGKLTITPADGTTVNGHTTALTVGGVTGDLTIDLGRGADEVDFDLANPIALPGNLTIDYGSSYGGNGNKITRTVNAAGDSLTVAHNLTIRYAAGNVLTEFDNLDVGGNVSVRHGFGDSTFTIDNVAGAGSFSRVKGNVTILNTQGKAENSLFDTNVGGSVAFANGLARAADNDAGFNAILNQNNTTTLATIGGSLSISNRSGDSNKSDFISDVDVKGDLTLGLGSGRFTAAVGAFAVSQAPVIEGDLTVTGTGADDLILGQPGTGLRVDGRLIARLGSRGDGLDLNEVRVGAATSITTGAGNDSVFLDAASGSRGGSVFAGAFRLNTGGGTDQVAIDSNQVAGPTDFKGPVRVNLGAGADQLFLATAGTVKFEAAVGLPVIFDGGTGANTMTVTLGNLPNRVPTFLHFTP
jgi:hypothetical protein